MFKRIFVVGCPRSGTTFLQSLMAAHPRLRSFPETHFWDFTIPKQRRYRWPKIYTEREKKLVREYLTEHEFPPAAMSHFKTFYFSYRGWSKALIQVLDNLTVSEFSGWVEKTPRHLYSIPFIKAAEPDALFLHILRDGKDVIASLYDVTQKYPEKWDGALNIDECIVRWKKAIRHSQQYLDSPYHSFVLYDDLLHHRKEILPKICNFLDLEYDPDMVQNYTDEARNLVGDQEQWKQANIRGKNSTDKFSDRFTTKEQHYIIHEIENISLGSFRNKIKKPNTKSGATS